MAEGNSDVVEVLESDQESDSVSDPDESTVSTSMEQTTPVQPSSAAAERVFSILQRFTAQQQSSLEDYMELSIMLQYNLVH